MKREAVLGDLKEDVDFTRMSSINNAKMLGGKELQLNPVCVSSSRSDKWYFQDFMANTKDFDANSKMASSNSLKEHSNKLDRDAFRTYFLHSLVCLYKYNLWACGQLYFLHEHKTMFSA